MSAPNLPKETLNVDKLVEESLLCQMKKYSISCYKISNSLLGNNWCKIDYKLIWLNKRRPRETTSDKFGEYVSER